MEKKQTEREKKKTSQNQYINKNQIARYGTITAATSQTYFVNINKLNLIE